MLSIIPSSPFCENIFFSFISEMIMPSGAFFGFLISMIVFEGNDAAATM